MDVCADNFGDSPCEEVPDYNATVVAPHSQEGAPAVEGAGESHADTVQSPICLLSTDRHKQFTFLMSHRERFPTSGAPTERDMMCLLPKTILIIHQKKNMCRYRNAGSLPLDSSARTTLKEKQ